MLRPAAHGSLVCLRISVIAAARAYLTAIGNDLPINLIKFAAGLINSPGGSSLSLAGSKDSPAGSRHSLGGSSDSPAGSKHSPAGSSLSPAGSKGSPAGPKDSPAVSK